MRDSGHHGRSRLSILFVVVTAGLMLVGCPSDPEVGDNYDAGVQDDVQDDVQDNGTDDFQVTITAGPQGSTAAEVGDVLTFEFDGPDCEDCSYECGLGDELGECDSREQHEISVEADDEGDQLFTVEVRDDGDVADDTRDFEITFDFGAAIEGLVDHTITSHPYLGDYDVACEHPNCETSCHWEVDGDQEADFDCPAGESFKMREAIGQLDDDFHGDASLVLTASSTVADREATVSYLFEFTDPSWSDVDAGGAHSCGILDDATLWCFGDDSDGQLGIGSDTDVPHIVGADDEDLFDLDWTDVSAGKDHTCGVAEGEVYCWGSSSDDRLGHDSDNTARPHPIEVDEDWTAVDAGGAHTCGLTAEDELYCWGRNQEDQLGIGDDDLDSTSTPSLVEDNDIDGWQAVSAGDEHTCGIDVDGDGWCWGNDGDERLGTIELDDDSSNLDDLSEIKAGLNHSCIVRNSGQLGCWGSGSNGKTGFDDDVDSVQYQSGNFTAVTAGDEHTCAADEDGHVFCWGLKLNGRLGDGSELTDGSSTDEPQLVQPLDDSGHISAGAEHTCAIAEGSISCWGNGTDGQLGDGTTDSESMPVSLDWPYFGAD